MDNVIILHPCQRDTGKYAALGPNIMLPEGCIMLPEGRRPEGSIMQPQGSIMWPVGGIFSCSRGQGWHIKIITWQVRIKELYGPRAVSWKIYGPMIQP